MSQDECMSLKAITTGEAARHLNVSGETVRRWAHSGYLRHTLLPSGRLRFELADLDEALRQVERQPTPAAS